MKVSSSYTISPLGRRRRRRRQACGGAPCAWA
uniref:Uncharacterized protein n=1 Tax=Arundo donax TaxID=35708 RepID=A0A0A9EWH9_ARUDO